MCVFLKDLCRSGSDWAESFNMVAVWFQGVPCRISLDYNDTIHKLFHKCSTNSASIVHRSHRSHVRTRANHCRAQAHNTTLRNKWINTCSSAGWTRILPLVRSRSVHLNWLLWINDTKQVQTESVPVWGDPEDNKLELDSVDARVYLAASPTLRSTSRVDEPDAPAGPKPDWVNVCHAFSLTLLSRLLCVWCRKNRLLFGWWGTGEAVWGTPAVIQRWWVLRVEIFETHSVWSV